MAVRHGYGKIAGTDALVFAYDTGDTRNSYKGEPTTNLIPQMAATIGGNTSLSYPQTVYISTALETNVVDPTAPGGQYSRFVGNTESANNQLYTTFNSAGIDVRNTTITYSVYLKGSGTCHLTIYADNAGYGTSPTITLTNEWTRYTYTRAVTNYTANCWVAVRGLYPTTNVYVAAQQAEIKSHATQFVNGTRSATQGLLDLTGNNSIDLTNVSFDSNAQMTFDGTNDYVDLGSDKVIKTSGGWTVESVVYYNAVAGGYNNITSPANFIGSDSISYNSWYWSILSNKLALWNMSPGVWKYGSTTLQANTWYHTALVCYDNGTQYQMYLNGIAEGGDHTTYSWNPDRSGLRVRYIGRGNSTNIRVVNGNIPITKIYNRVLSAEEIKSNFNHYKNRFGI